MRNKLTKIEEKGKIMESKEREMREREIEMERERNYLFRGGVAAPMVDETLVEVQKGHEAAGDFWSEAQTRPSFRRNWVLYTPASFIGPPFLDENRNQNSFQLAKPGSDSLFDLY